MISLELHLQNFLSYKTMPEPIRFDDASLWILSGPNGAGKSTIFDAITYALYGVHRGSGRQMQNREARLIHRGQDSMRVEFTFLANGQKYKIVRTRTRSGKPTTEARRWLGEKWSAVISDPNTEDEDQFGRWVQSADVIGMDKEGFLASVLLRQGKQNELLEAKGADRRKILCQILDFSAYKRLWERVEAEAKEQRNEEKRCADEVKKIPNVTEEEITLAAEKEKQANQEYRRWDEAHSAAVACKSKAEQWETLIGEQTGKRTDLDTVTAMLNRADEIRRNAARFTLLEQGIPPLQQFLNARNEVYDWEAKETPAIELETTAKETWEKAKDEQTAAEQEWQKLDTQDRELQSEELEVSKTIAELAHAISELDQREETFRQQKHVEVELAKFPAELDADLAKAQERLRDLEETQRVLIPLAQYRDERRKWHNADVEARTYTQEAARLKDVLTANQKALESAYKETAAAFDEMQAKLRDVTTAKTLRDAAKRQYDRFQETREQADCLYCGQPLLPEHREKHEQELLARKSATQEEWKQADDVAQNAKTCWEAKQIAQKTCDIELQASKTQHTEVETAAAQARQRQNNCVGTARTSLQLLPKRFQRAVCPDPEGEISAAFTQAYPSDADMDKLQTQCDTLQTVKAEGEQLAKLVSKRNEWKIKRVQLELQPRQYCLGKSPEQIRAENQTALTRAKRIETERMALAQSLKTAKLDKGTKITAAQTAETTWSKATEIRKTIADSKRKADVALAGCEAKVPSHWQSEKETLTPERLQSLEAENTGLRSAPDELQALDQKQDEIKTLQERLKQIETEIQNLPEEAKRASNEIQTEIDAALLARNAARDAETTAHNTLMNLEHNIANRARWEARRQKASRQANLATRLGKLLDDQTGLQAILVKQALGDVITRANIILNALSGSQMQIELRETDKDCDLLVQKSGHPGELFDTAFLSGSEMFRVSVSMALGIGEYASINGQRTPCVIIDEGFGALDEPGRHDIIDALLDLRDRLEKVIIVSHQQEFFNRFPDRYEILKDETGCSQAKRFSQ